MGCDIHLFIERRTADGWRTIIPPAPPPREQRAEQRTNRDGKPYEYVSPFWGPGFYASPCYGLDGEGPSDYGAEVNPACVAASCAKCMGTGRDLRWWHDRNYVTFAVLSGTVRNAGNIRGIVAEPRGLPADTCATTAVQDFDHSATWLTLDEVLAFDWQATFVSHGVIPLTKRTGPWQEDADYQSWRDEKPRGCPKSWSGAVAGGGTYTVTMADADRILAVSAAGRRVDKVQMVPDRDSLRFGLGGRPETVIMPDPSLGYVEVGWSQTYASRATSFLACVTDYMVPLGDPKDTRLVFGFDS